MKQSPIVTRPPLPNNYAPEFLVLDRGDGVYLTDTAGKSYLDFGSGIAVNALGYGREDLAETGYRQMQKLIHSSNLYTTEPTLSLAKRLTKMGTFAAVQFGNSGSEANEAAIKYARLYALRTRGAGHFKILSLENGFHGRTMGALSCTPTPKYQEPFTPLVPGMTSIPFNDVKRLETVLDGSFACVIVEVIQGEGGLRVMTPEFARALGTLTREYDVLLCADEIQTGLGRTGYAFASEIVGLKPDIITLSKPLAGGLPLSATMIPKKVNDLLHTGEHGTTFGGGPVTTAVAGKVLDTLLDTSFLASVREKGEFLKEKLTELKAANPRVAEVRGAGLLQGLVLDLPAEREADTMKSILTKSREEGLLLLTSGSNVIRIAPPLIIDNGEIEKGIIILSSVLAEVTKEK